MPPSATKIARFFKRSDVLGILMQNRLIFCSRKPFSITLLKTSLPRHLKVAERDQHFLTKGLKLNVFDGYAMTHKKKW
jgi:hypothetical protein